MYGFWPNSCVIPGYWPGAYWLHIQLFTHRMKKKKSCTFPPGPPAQGKKGLTLGRFHMFTGTLLGAIRYRPRLAVRGAFHIYLTFSRHSGDLSPRILGVVGAVGGGWGVSYTPFDGLFFDGLKCIFPSLLCPYINFPFCSHHVAAPFFRPDRWGVVANSVSTLLVANILVVVSAIGFLPSISICPRCVCCFVSTVGENFQGEPHYTIPVVPSYIVGDFCL